MAAPEPIDFEKMRKQEIARAAKVHVFKQISREDLYNILQDFRHVCLLDLRPYKAFYKHHIRDSFCIENAHGGEVGIHRYFEDAEKKHSANEEKYNIKPIRRVVLIDSKEKPFNESDGLTKMVMETIKKFGGFDKVNFLKQGIEHFTEKFPYLCLNFEERDIEVAQEVNKQVNEEGKAQEKPLLNNFEKKMLYAYSRFPTEIIEGKLYLGSVHNANNRLQMNDLGIKAIMEFISYKESKPLEYKTQEYLYRNIPVDEETINFIDFSVVCKEIDEILQDQSKGPLLICCNDGDSISPCFAIAYLMWHKKMSLTIASVAVYQKRGTAEANKHLYTIMSTWQPQGVEANKRGLPGWFGK